MRGFVAFLGALAFCSGALAQTGGWAAVEGIAPGARVEVRLSPPATVQGVVASVSASGLVVQKPGGAVRHIARARIAKVYLVAKSHKLRDALIGAGLGGAGGAVYGYRRLPKYSDSFAAPVPNNRVGSAAYFALLVGAIGAAIGALIGLHGSKTLVYRRASSGAGKTAGGGVRHRPGGLPARPNRP